MTTHADVLRTVRRGVAVMAVALPGTVVAQGTRHVAVKFQPMVGAEAFACGRTYAGVGTSKATLKPSDFALYVSDVRLVAASGEAVPVQLDQDGVFQDGNVALLDFEDGTGPCSNGNALTHTAVAGTVPDGKYVGVQFTIGIPFERNHLELVTQPSPLSVTRMFWAWASGHKFLRFDAKSDAGKSWVLHLGSAGCVPTGSATTAPTSCAQGNRVPVTIDAFDVDADVVIADASVLFAKSGGAENQVCMSSPKTAACAGMFAALGLPFNDQPAAGQTFLRRGTAAKAADRQ